MRKYTAQNKELEKSVEMLVKGVPTRFVGMVICTSRAIPKWDLKRI